MEPQRNELGHQRKRSRHRSTVLGVVFTARSTTIPRAAACLFPIPERNEMWLVGGVVDPSSQWNDEEESSLMEVYDVTNGTWSVAPNPIPNTQSYAGCARWGDTLVLAGDLPLPDPQSSVPSFTTGIVQRYNLTTDTWSTGTRCLPLKRSERPAMPTTTVSFTWPVA